MSLQRLIIGSAAMLFVTGCVSPPRQPIRAVAYSAIGPDDVVVDETRDDVRPRRRPRSRVALHHATGVEPLAALEQSRTWRAGWRNERIDYGTLQRFDRGASDPYTTVGMKPKSTSSSATAQDAYGSIGRPADIGKKATAPICQGC